LGIYSRIAFEAMKDMSTTNLASKMKQFQKDMNQQSDYQETAGQNGSQNETKKSNTQSLQLTNNQKRRTSGQQNSVAAGNKLSQTTASISATTDWQQAILMSEIISVPMCKKRHGRGGAYGNQGNAGR
jgi:hypothetical protein